MGVSQGVLATARGGDLSPRQPAHAVGPEGMKQIGRLYAMNEQDEAGKVFWTNIQVAEELGHAVVIQAMRDVTTGHITHLTAWATPTVTLPTGSGS